MGGVSVKLKEGYQATVRGVHPDGSVSLLYNDGDEEENARSLGHGDSLGENARGCKSSDGAAGIWRIYDRPAVQVVACFRKSNGMPGPEGEGEGLEGLPALCYGESMSTANDSGSYPRSGCGRWGCRAPGCQKIAHRMR